MFLPKNQPLCTFNNPCTGFTAELDLACIGLHSSEKYSIQSQCIRQYSNAAASLVCFFKEKRTSVCVTSKS